MKQVEITWPHPSVVVEPPTPAPVAEGALAAASDAEPTREQRRSRRKREVRARTISVKRMTKRELELGRLLYPDAEEASPRPRTRAECKSGPRPCPYVSCEHHLYLDVSARTGAIKLNFPDLEVWELTESCALDVSDRGGATLEDVGAIMNLTRERIRQIEVRGLAKMQAEIETRGLRDLVDHGTSGKRRLPVLEQREEEPDEHEAETYEGTHGEPGFDVDHFASDALDAE